MHRPASRRVRRDLPAGVGHVAGYRVGRRLHRAGPRRWSGGGKRSANGSGGHLDNKERRPYKSESLLASYEVQPVPHDVIATCPVCSGELAVTRLRCGTCGTTIEGEFGVGRFARLNREQMQVLVSFLRSRGNLRDMERELQISYPTVRARVEALVRALGFGPRDEPDDAQPAALAEAAAATATASAAATAAAAEILAARREVLEQLARHELSAEDAAEAIRALGRTAR